MFRHYFGSAEKGGGDKERTPLKEKVEHGSSKGKMSGKFFEL